MAWDKKKTALTTGDISKVAGVNFRTVIRWIQHDRLKAFQLPGRGDNRILVTDYISFAEENKIPIPDEMKDLSKRVLIIEDDKRMVRAIERALSPDFEIKVAANGFEAGTLVHSFAPAIVTIEPRMKGTGINAIKTLSADPNLLTSSVLVVSVLPKEKQDEAIEAGAAAVVAKPFSKKDLRAAVSGLVGKKS